jgi:hypothetical protein
MKFRLATGMSILGLMLSCATALGGTLEGPLQIMVSKDLQELKIYDGGVVVATSRVSTGKAGHSTPTGIFSILEKKRSHFSNIYDNAPMPFMQRLTWSGIALHASNSVPSYPASHGCVRLPNDFAKSLFGLTRRGGHVLITDREIAPQRIVHALLFKPSVVVPDTPLLFNAGYDRSEAVGADADRPENRAGPHPHPHHPPRRTRDADRPADAADLARL